MVKRPKLRATIRGSRNLNGAVWTGDRKDMEVADSDGDDYGSAYCAQAVAQQQRISFTSCLDFLPPFSPVSRAVRCYRHLQEGTDR
jgi:hypothetical protein